MGLEDYINGQHLHGFLEEKWGESGSPLIQTFEISEKTWNKLFVLLFHKQDHNFGVQCTRVVIEIEHAMGIALFINKQYTG